MPWRMMCGPSWATHSQTGSIINTQTFVENKVNFKSGTTFVPNRAVSLECHEILTVNPRHEYQNVPTGEIHVKPLARNELHPRPLRLSRILARNVSYLYKTALTRKGTCQVYCELKVSRGFPLSGNLTKSTCSSKFKWNFKLNFRLPKKISQTSLTTTFLTR